jgi:hypothetical protein
MDFADIANMRKDVTGNPGSPRPKSGNHAGLYLVTRNESKRRSRASRTSRQCATGITPRHLGWTAFGTFMVGVLCLLIK